MLVFNGADSDLIRRKMKNTDNNHRNFVRITMVSKQDRLSIFELAAFAYTAIKVGDGVSINECSSA